MKVMLINPPRFNGLFVIREERCAGISPTSLNPPLGLAYTTSFLMDNNYEVKLIDANGENLDFNSIRKEIKSYSPDLIILKTSPATMRYDLKITDIAKKINPNTKTALDDSIVGATLPKEILSFFPNLDIVIKGEPELTSLNLCKALEKGSNLKKVGGIAFRDSRHIYVTRDGERIKDLDTLPFPAYDFLPISEYFSVSFSKKTPWTTMMSSRGCSFGCIYCLVGAATVWRGYGKIPRFRSAKNVVNEMELLAYEYGVKDIEFWDENITMNKKRLMEICNEIVKRKLPLVWSCNSRADTVDKEMLMAMKKAGCWNIVYGVESGSQKILDGVKKQIRLETIKKTFRITREVGMNASSSFMVGLPGETKETVEQTLRFAKEIDPDFAQFGICTPYPGTIMEEMAREKKWIRGFELDRYDPLIECIGDSIIMNMDTMTSEDIAYAQKYIVREFYFRPKIFLKRILKARSKKEFEFLFRSASYLIRRGFK